MDTSERFLLLSNSHENYLLGVSLFSPKITDDLSFFHRKTNRRSGEKRKNP